MTEYETRTLSMIVMPKGEAVFSARATEVRIQDDSGGEFVEVIQTGSRDLGKIMIDPDEWPTLCAAIGRMIAECREQK